MKNYYPYPCTRCGACCRHVDLIAEMKNFNRGDGVCKHLTAENLCEIYSERPPLCNGEYVYKKFFADKTVEEFHEIISQLCKKFGRRKLEKLFEEVSDAGREKFAGGQAKHCGVAERRRVSEKI